MFMCRCLLFALTQVATLEQSLPIQHVTYISFFKDRTMCIHAGINVL